MRVLAFLFFTVGSLLPSFLVAQEKVEITPSDPPGHPAIQALLNGKVHFNLRFRAEVADADGAKRSEAFTSRLRLGYGTGEYYGLSLFADFEDIRAVDDDTYNAAGLNGEGRRTVIADPEATELNQAYANYFFEPAKTTIRGGRQRITLDDHRFVGNVGWRQNEQTYDGILIENKFIEDLVLRYAYISDVNRIFGDDSSAAVPTARRDFDSDSHFFNVSFSGLDFVDLTGFAYLLNLRGRDPSGGASSSDTIGLRAKGSVAVNEDIDIHYAGSYAFQVDNGDNPTDYKANYWFIEGSVALDVLTAIVGFEVLGSSNGRAQFQTPLATGHKFNGWADSFLDNGGPQGLQDFYFGFAANLPSEFQGKLFYHKFNKDDGGGDLGWEIDAVVSRKITDQITALMKYAYFDGKEDPDLFRVWMDLVISF